MQLSRRMVKLMKLTTLSTTVAAVLLLSVWTLAACTIVADDGTTYQIFTPALSVEDNGTPAPVTPEPGEEPDEDLAADVIVQFDDHALIVRAIEFSTPISGLHALELTGLDLTIADTGFGPAVCAIEGVGCPADDCFCGGDTFWGYNFWNGEAWEGYPVGASTSVISTTGAIEGWRWGEWGASAAPAPQAQAAQSALAWLGTQQNAEDGSYSGAVSAGLDVLLALGANHQSAADWRVNEDSPSLLDFTVANSVPYAESSVSEAGKLALALGAAAGCYPADAPVPTSYFDAELNSMAPEAGPLALAILGTLALAPELVDADALPASVDYLLELAQTEGGWEWFPGWGSDSNTTALAIQALTAAGVAVDHPAIAAGVAALLAAQNSDGGFPYSLGEADAAPSDTNSTAYAIQGLVAGGEAVNSAALDYLREQQLENGAFVWQPGQDANRLATQQAIPALLGRTYPLQAGTLALCGGE